MATEKSGKRPSSLLCALARLLPFAPAVKVPPVVLARWCSGSGATQPVQAGLGDASLRTTIRGHNNPEYYSTMYPQTALRQVGAWGTTVCFEA